MRAGTRSFAKVIAGTGLGLALSACAAPGPTESSETERTVEACLNDDVQAALGEWEGAGGQIVGFVVFAARTDRPCTLAGAPELRLMDASGLVIAEAPERPPAIRDPLIVLVPGTGAPAQGGPRLGQGSFRLSFGNSCVPVAQGPGRVEVRLPGESEALVFATDLPRPGCTTRNEPPFLGVRPFASHSPE
jgi:hypothetical protein